MNKAFSFLSTRPWILVIAFAIVLAGTSHAVRIWHVNHVSNLAGGDAIAVDAESPTGYEAGTRRLVVPERNANSIQWIMQAQKMFAEGTWRLKRVDYDNAPEGRAVRTASLYRWWLGGIAWIDHALSGEPLGIAVERAALIADPLAQLIFLSATSVFIVRYFGGWLAALFAMGLVALFPLGGAFSPGQPDDSVFAVICAAWSALPLLAGLARLSRGDGERARQTCRRLFLAGGVAGGFGMWFGVADELPILVGIAVAGAVAGFAYSRQSADSSGYEMASLPWRVWALGGATVMLLAWLIDRSPALLDASAWRADFAQPLYAFAMLGCGELLTFLDTRRRSLSKRRIAMLALSAIAICGAVYTMVSRPDGGGWEVDPASARLSRLPIDPGVSGVVGWMQEADGSALMLAAFAPSLLLVAGVLALVRNRRSAIEAKALALALGPAIVALGFAVARLGWWNQLDALLLVLAVAALSMAKLSKRIRGSFIGVTIGASLLGILFVMPNMKRQMLVAVNRVELEILIERHLAQWLARRADEPGAVALAPPNLTLSLAFYGGLRGVGTPYPENFDGVAAAVRLSAASTPDEARALVEGRQIQYIVHPSWDTFLEEYARLGSKQPENSFIALLNRWLPPRWLEPVSFQLPSVQGFEGEWVGIFRTVEMQDNASAIARLVEYFLDSGRKDQAELAQKALAEGFPEELAIHITGAQVAAGKGERGVFGREIGAILSGIEAGSHEYLPWDLRVSMTLMLAGGKRIEEAKAQLEWCLKNVTKDRIRRLSGGSLNGLLRLAKATRLEFPDTELYHYSVSLLPPEYREGL